MARSRIREVRTETLSDRIEIMGRDLRSPLRALVEDLGGIPPRPNGLIRSIGLDKSLAGRIVRAVRAGTDLEFMHLVPSPSGLRILVDRARGAADPETLEEIADLTQRFRQLLDSTPGGRDAIDAQIAESSGEVREKAEHVAKQSAFKSMSFLLGHFCETLATSLFLVPASDDRAVDGVEISTRIGVQRMRPSASLTLLGVLTPEEPPDPGALRIESLSGGSEMTDFMLPEFSSEPLPELDVVNDGLVTRFVLAGDPSGSSPKQITSAFVIRNGWERDPGPGLINVRGYVLTLPSRSFVLDVYVAEGLFPSAIPSVSFAYPTPGGFVNTRPEGQVPDYGRLELGAPIEQLSTGSRRRDVPGVPNHRALVESVLARSGHENTPFRGWRCTLAYPVTFAEMVWSMRLTD